MSKTIHIVIGSGIVLGAYTRADSAFLHARCVTGADVVACELMDSVSPSVRADLEADEDWEDAGDTPVVDVEDMPDAESGE